MRVNNLYGSKSNGLYENKRNRSFCIVTHNSKIIIVFFLVFVCTTIAEKHFLLYTIYKSVGQKLFQIVKEIFCISQFDKYLFILDKRSRWDSLTIPITAA